MVFLDDQSTGNQCLAEEGVVFLPQLLDQQEDSYGGKGHEILTGIYGTLLIKHNKPTYFSHDNVIK